MVKILKDNTNRTYYTKCKNCGSELEYDYGDVEFKELPFSYHTDKRITCPACNSITMAELTPKDEYKDIGFSYKSSDTSMYSLLNSCCAPAPQDKNGGV